MTLILEEEEHQLDSELEIAMVSPKGKGKHRVHLFLPSSYGKMSL